MKTLEQQLEELTKASREADANALMLQGAVKAIQMAINEADAPEETETSDTE